MNLLLYKLEIIVTKSWLECSRFWSL